MSRRAIMGIKRGAWKGEVEQAAALLDKSRQSGGLGDEDVPAIRSVLQGCASEGKSVLALKTLSKVRKMGIRVDRSMYLDAVKSINRDKQDDKKSVKALDDVRRQMNRENLPLGEDLGMRMIHMFARWNSVDHAFQVSKQIRKRGAADTAAFTTLIRAFSGQAENCLQLWELMESKKTAPDTRAYNALISSLANDPRSRLKAFEVFDTMMEEGMKPDQYTFTILLKFAHKTRHFEYAQKIMDFMERWPRLTWDLPLLNILVRVASHGKCPERVIERAMDAAGKQRIPLDIDTWNLLIDFRARLAQVDAAFQTAGDAENDGFQLNEATYTALFTACRAAGDPVRAFETFLDLPRHIRPDNEVHARVLQSTFERFERPDLLDEYRERVAAYRKKHGRAPAKERQSHANKAPNKKISKSRKKFLVKVQKAREKRKAQMESKQ